jgi:outer membrane immunogenic protein
MNYKTMCGAVGVALAFGVSAQAADLGGRHGGYKDEPVYAPVATWAGSYVGGHLGAAWTSGSADLTTDYWSIDQGNEKVYQRGGDSGHQDLSDTSFLGGVHAGHNWQQGAFVYGVEGDVSFANNIDYLASVRGRLGVAAGNWLFYGTGGVAFVGASTSGSISDGFKAVENYDMSQDQVGYVVGGGAEVKLNPNWSVGVEGLYYGFDGVSQHVAGTTSWGQNHFYDYDLTAESGADVGVVRGRVSYHFNRGYAPLK